MKNTKVKTALIHSVVLVIGIIIGIVWKSHHYNTLCLDLGGGKNPGDYPICVVEKTNVSHVNEQQGIHKRRDDLCDENGNRYANTEEARQAGLSDAEFGATYCPEYKMDSSWDLDNDGINDCYNDNSCSKDLDYMSSRPQSESSQPEKDTQAEESTQSEQSMIIMIPKLEWNDIVGEFVVNYHKATVPKSPAVLNTVYKKLFDENEYNGTYEGTKFKSVSIINGVAQVYLTGTWRPTGDMSNLYFTRNIEAAAFQYPNVKEVQVYLNGEPFDWCVDDESDGETGCPETQYLWNVTRDEYESY